MPGKGLNQQSLLLLLVGSTPSSRAGAGYWPAAFGHLSAAMFPSRSENFQYLKTCRVRFATQCDSWASLQCVLEHQNSIENNVPFCFFLISQRKRKLERLISKWNEKKWWCGVSMYTLNVGISWLQLKAIMLGVQWTKSQQLMMTENS